MPMTLRKHVEEALLILSCDGRRTTDGGGGSTMAKSGNPTLDYALSVKMVVEKFDSTRYAVIYLQVSDEAAPGVARQATDSVWNRVEKDMRRMRKALRAGGIAVGRG